MLLLSLCGLTAADWKCNPLTYQCQRNPSGQGWYGPNYPDPEDPGWKDEDECDGACVFSFTCKVDSGLCPRFPACVGPYTNTSADPEMMCGDDLLYSTCHTQCDTTVHSVGANPGRLDPAFTSPNVKYTVQEEPDVRGVTLSVQAFNDRLVVFIDQKQVAGQTDDGMTTWLSAPIPIGNGTRTVPIAVGLEPTLGGAVRTYTIDIVQNQPKSCMAASGGELTWGVEECARQCNSRYGGSAPLTTGNLDWALNDTGVQHLLESMFKGTAPVHPPFEELATRIDYLLTNFSLVENKQQAMVDTMRSITKYFLTTVKETDLEFFECITDPTGAKCAPAQNISDLMFEKYSDLLHRNASLRDAAQLLKNEAVNFDTVWRSEVKQLERLKEDLDQSLQSPASVQLLGNETTACLAAGVIPDPWAATVFCACVGSSLISNSTDPCDLPSSADLVSGRTTALTGAADPQCGDIQPNGTAIPGAGNGSVAGVLTACEKVCTEDNLTSAPLVFGSISWTVPKATVEQVLTRLFPQSEDISPPFVAIKSNLSALRYNLLDVQGRTKPLETIINTVTQTLITKIPADNSEFHRCFADPTSDNCGQKDSLLTLIESRYDTYLEPLYSDDTKRLWDNLNASAKAFGSFLDTFKHDIGKSMEEVKLILNDTTRVLGLVKPPEDFCYNANQPSFCACANSLLTASSGEICGITAMYECDSSSGTPTCKAGPSGNYSDYVSCDANCGGGPMPTPAPPGPPPPGHPSRFDCHVRDCLGLF
jgi:hypothetical protein